VPLTEETRHLTSKEQLKVQKLTVILITSSPGAVVRKVALCEAPRSGQITAAGSDVTNPEPVSPDDPFLSFENSVIPLCTAKTES